MVLLCVTFLRIHYYDIITTVNTSNTGIIVVINYTGNIDSIYTIGNSGNSGIADR